MLLRYNSTTGVLDWEAIYDTGAPTYFKGVCKDFDGNIYVAGHNSTSVHFAKYDSSGVQEWNKTWAGGSPSEGRSIYYNGFDALYITGKVNFTDPYNIVFIKYLLAPEDFTVISQGYGNPDNDGFINLNWTSNAPFDADFYTIHNSTSYITDINGSLEINALEIADTTFPLENLDDGTYYYIIEAHNKYGNSASKCIKIDVILKPGPFTINCTADDPDNDGIFELNWTESQYAKNYSIFYNIGDRDFLMKDGTCILNTSSSVRSVEINMSDKLNNDYSLKAWAINYFNKLVAVNGSGNYVSITLGLPPGLSHPFTISSPNAGSPDIDKEFTIVYGTTGDQVDYYELYYSTAEPSGIHYSSVYAAALSDMTLLHNGSTKFFMVSEADALPDGLVYFIVIGYNEYGNYTPAYFSLSLGNPPPVDNGIPWWIYPIITGIISACVSIAIKQTYSSVKKRRIIMQNVQDKFEQIDNIESYLKEKLDYGEWQRLQGHVDKYKKHQISNKDLIKVGKKEIGKDFTDIFLSKKKPKK